MGGLPKNIGWETIIWNQPITRVKEYRSPDEYLSWFLVTDCIIEWMTNNRFPQCDGLIFYSKKEFVRFLGPPPFGHAPMSIFIIQFVFSCTHHDSFCFNYYILLALLIAVTRGAAEPIFSSRSDYIGWWHLDLNAPGFIKEGKHFLKVHYGFYQYNISIYQYNI